MNNTIYGGLGSYPATPFLIDKVYNNRKEMDDACAEDGVFLGRYVMIRYCEENYDQEARKALHEKVKQDDASQIYFSEYNGSSEQSINYLENYLQDLNSGYDVDIFFGSPEASEYYSYDHTIWRKEQVPVYEIQEIPIETEYGTDLQRNKVQNGVQIKYASVANCNISYAPANIEINEAKGAGQIVRGEPYKAGTAEVFGWYCKKTGEDEYGNPVFENYGNWAQGAGSHAEGVGTYANGHGAHAEGSGNGFDVDNPSRPTGLSNIDEEMRVRAKGKGAHAEGRYTFAQGNGAHAEGLGTEASAGGAHAEGIGTLATNEYAHAEGQGSQATGIVSHAEGDNTTASGTASHSECYGAKAYGEHAHAEGNNTQAVGRDSHAEGQLTITYGIASHTEGIGTKTGQNPGGDGDFAHAEGYFTEARAQSSHAGGTYTIANQNSQTAIGQYNSNPTKSCLFIVGNGDSISKRSNALEVYKDGTVKVKYQNGMSPIISEGYLYDNVYKNYSTLNQINPTIWDTAIQPYTMRSWALSSGPGDGTKYLIPVIPLKLSDIFKAMANQSTLNMTIQTVFMFPYRTKIGDFIYEFTFDCNIFDDNDHFKYQPDNKENGSVVYNYNLAEYLLVQEVNKNRTGNNKKTYQQIYDEFIVLRHRDEEDGEEYGDYWWKEDVKEGLEKYRPYNEIAYDTVLEDRSGEYRHRTFPDAHGLYGAQLEIIKTQQYRGHVIFTQLTTSKTDIESNNTYKFDQYEGLFSSYGSGDNFYSVWGGWNLIVSKTQKSFYAQDNPYLGGYLFN